MLEKIDEYPARYEQFTAAMARDVLTRNASNRPIDHKYVRRIADAMLAGEWVVNGDTIRIDEKNSLLDGQHRLTALTYASERRSGSAPLALKFLVVRGLPRAVIGTVDINKKRSMGNTLHILRGTKNSNSVASAARLLLSLKLGRTPGDSNFKPTAAQIFALLDEHPHLGASYPQGMALARETGLNPTVAFSFVHLISAYREADPFLLGLMSGINLAPGDARIALRRFGHNFHTHMRHPGDRVRLQLNACFRTWNAYLRGQFLTKLVVPSDGAMPELLRGTPI